MFPVALCTPIPPHPVVRQRRGRKSVVCSRQRPKSISGPLLQTLADIKGPQGWQPPRMVGTKPNLPKSPRLPSSQEEAGSATSMVPSMGPLCAPNQRCKPNRQASWLKQGLLCVLTVPAADTSLQPCYRMSPYNLECSDDPIISYSVPLPLHYTP